MVRAMTEQHAVASALLDALVALDPDDHAASTRAVPVAMERLRDLVDHHEDGLTPVAYGAMTLAHACIALVATVKDVDRLDVIAALRPLFDQAEEPAA
jgi:hypothetical protein